MTTILVVDDHPAVVDALRLLFKEEGWRAVGLTDPARTAAVAELEGADLALVDMNFERDTTSGAEGMAILEQLKSARPGMPVVLMTAWGTVERAVEAMRHGAADYLTKPWDNDRLVTTCRVHLNLAEAQRANRLLVEQNRVLRRELDQSFDFSRIIGQSRAMVDVLQLIARVAPTDATTLITGPPGTGKELVAHALHANSRRRSGPLVKVHIGALPDSLFERELFGNVKGAFTDAREDRPGRFAIADGGTLFLDEVATLAPAQQVRLLRVLQEGEFEPLGSTRTQKVDVRILAATNVDLKVEVAAGRFREDLYYRLNGIEIHLSALRERPEDIVPLADRFLTLAARHNGKNLVGFSAEALKLMLGYAWPGNIRELKNVVERAVILCQGDRVTSAELPLMEPVLASGAAAKTVDLERLTLADLERALIQRALDHHQGNVTQAARGLGLSRPALYRRMAKFGLDASDGDQ